MNCYYYSTSTGQTDPGNIVLTFTKSGTVTIVWGNGSYNWDDSGPVYLYLNDVEKETAGYQEYQKISTYIVNSGDVKIQEYDSVILLFQMTFEVEPEIEIPNQINLTGLIGWFDGDSFDSTTGTWKNKITNGANASTTGTIDVSNSDASKETGGSFNYIYGNTYQVQ